MSPSSRFSFPARSLRVSTVLAAALLVCLLRYPAGGTDLWGHGECDIVFSEVHYHPAKDREELEFVEIHNRGIHWVDVSGWKLVEGVEYTFPGGTVIGPGGHLAVARSAAALKERAPGAPIVGDFDGRLANGGEILRLLNRTERTIARLHYGDGGRGLGELWPGRADGRGPSLELVRPSLDWDHPWSWASSRVLGGTPGRKNSVAREPGAGGPSFERRPKLRINELSWGSPPVFVELYNTGGESIALDGLHLLFTGGKDGGGEEELELSGSIGPGRHERVSGERLDELLASRPEMLYLLGEGEILIDSLEVPELPEGETALPRGASIGRYPDGDRDTWFLEDATPGRRNSPPSSHPVVINEIFYHGTSDATTDEFLELHNAGRSPVSLDGWRLTGGIRFEFPEGTEIAAGSYLVVAKDPARLRPSVSAGARDLVLGPFDGKLSNAGESVTLRDRRGNEIDRVRYDDREPWPRGADGGGFSIELLDPALDNRWGEAWTLGPVRGSPAAGNERASDRLPPRIVEVRHDPPVPEPGGTLDFEARVISSYRLSRVVVVYYEMLPGGDRSRTIQKTLREGVDPDGRFLGAGRFTVRIRVPSAAEGRVFGYRIIARDGRGRTAEAPSPSLVASSRNDDVPAQQDYLFTVARPDDRYPGLPRYRVVMAPAEWKTMADEARGRSKNWHPCSLVARVRGGGLGDEDYLFHGAAIRYRGNNSRRPGDGRYSYRVRLASGDTLDGRDRLILNAFRSFRQRAGGEIMKLAGLPAPRAMNVRLTLPDADDLRYVQIEVVHNEFLEDEFGDSSNNLYRGYRGNPVAADFRYHGPDPEQYRAVYRRENHDGRDDDLSGLIKLLQALETPADPTSNLEDAFVKSVEGVIDVDEWVTYFVVNNVLGNEEGGLSTDHADDYYLYQKPRDGRFVLIPWDHDTTFDDEDMPLFRPSLPPIRKLLRHPAFAPLYHRRTRELLDGPLSRPIFRRYLRELDQTFESENLERLASFVEERQVFLRELQPLWPNARIESADPNEEQSVLGSRLFVPGFTQSVSLAGFADPALAFGVRAGGRRADYDPVSGRWRSTLPFESDPSTFWIELLGREGRSVALYPVRLEKTARIRRSPGTIRGNTVWTAGGGPILIEGDTVVSSGSTLAIRPGVEIICAADARLVVGGRLEVEGEARDPVAFRTASWSRPWRGILLRGSGAGQGSVLRHARFEGGRGQETSSAPAAAGSGPAIETPFLHAEGGEVTLESCLLRGIRGTALVAAGATLRLRDVAITDSRRGVAVLGGSCDIRDSRFLRLRGTGLEVSGLRGSGRVDGSTFHDIQGEAIRAGASELVLSGGAISGVEVALELSGGAKARAEKVVVAACASVAVLDPAGEAESSGRSSRPSSLEITDGVLAVPDGAFLPGADSSLALDGCRLSPRALLPEAVAEKDTVRELPRFAGPARGDFRIVGDGARTASARR